MTTDTTDTTVYVGHGSAQALGDYDLRAREHAAEHPSLQRVVSEGLGSTEAFERTVDPFNNPSHPQCVHTFDLTPEQFRTWQDAQLEY